MTEPLWVGVLSGLAVVATRWWDDRKKRKAMESQIEEMRYVLKTETAPRIRREAKEDAEKVQGELIELIHGLLERMKEMEQNYLEELREKDVRHLEALTKVRGETEH